MTRINICILAYRRADLLQQCLQSLAAMDKPADTLIRVTVIENDEEQRCKVVVELFAEQVPIQVDYVCEPKRGIPVARNTAIDVSHSWHADYIVFIDDDEWVEEQWLNRLYAYCVACGGDAVISGEVIAVFPEHTPDYISGLIKNKRRQTGTVLTTCATNNVIFPVSLTRDLGLRFDTSVPLAGGTDTRFFTEAYHRGIKIVKCADAIVYEKVPETRATLRWMISRKYRVGITDVWRRRYNGESLFKIVMSVLLQVTVNSVRVLIYAITNRKLKRNLSILKLAKAAGSVAGLFGVSVESYASTP